MIIDLGSGGSAQIGGKARSLDDLILAGFDVPAGFVVDKQTIDSVLASCRETLDRLYGELTPSSVPKIGAALRRTTASLQLLPEIEAEIEQRLAPELKYAVRSSAAREDGSDLSYAGQFETYLDVASADVPARIVDCYRSSLSDAALTYMLDHGEPAAPMGFAVVVQEMVPAEVSGVAFTVNPLTGADTEIVIEAGEGLGADLVAGRIHAATAIVDWFTGETMRNDGLLSHAELAAVADAALTIQRHYGFPVDVEWAIAEGRLRILQARPITRLAYTGIADQWSTADFKDGGVSATVCTPFMWSLYSYIWEDWLKKFILDSGLLRDSDLRPLGRMFYGRPYWNMSVVKDAMAAVPGFTERQFDEEFGVAITYEGPGRTTPVNPRTLVKIGQVALRQRRIVAVRRKYAESIRNHLLDVAQSYADRLTTALTPRQVVDAWRGLVTDDYHASEGAYFWQIFINTVQQALGKDAITKVVGAADYFTLIGGLEDVSHLRPFEEAWALSRTIRANDESSRYWRDHTVAEITAEVDAGRAEHGLDTIAGLITRYGYHSVKELDVTYPDFDTDHAAVVSMVADAVALTDDYGPNVDRTRHRAAYDAILATLRHRLSPRAFEAFVGRVERTRDLLWWREEFRDVSTRYYHLIRCYTLLLAEQLVAEGVLADASDVWFATMPQLVSYVDGVQSADDLRAAIDRQRAYYDSFRNYLSENEIGHVFDRPRAPVLRTPGAIHGVGGSNGVVEGTARVVTGLEEIGRLQPGDILVTRFTDTGWTSKFAMISGLVTEYGGVLCHAAIVSREYGIPCVVAATDAMRLVPDGSQVRVDGTAGDVVVL